MEKENQKKSMVKTYVIFAVVMIACFLVGALSGAISVSLGEAFATVGWYEIMNILLIPIVILFAIVVIGTFAFSLIYFNMVVKKIKEASKLEDDEYEDALAVLNKKMAVPMVLEGLAVYLGFFFFALIMYFDFSLEKADISTGPVAFVASITIFLLSIALYLFSYNIFIEKIKEIYPEKQGNVFELNFRKKWMNSFDEAEKLKFGERAARAYSAGTFACMLMWIVSIIGMMSFDTGFLPILVCCVVLITMYVTVSIEGKKKGKEKTK